MLKIRKNIIFLFIIFAVSQLSAQTDDFSNPVDFRMLLSGTYAELRSDHFHSGIDIKTDQVVGKPIFAIADGYVSRINISPSGFGNALYITHPNGLVSVYAHLQDFKNCIKEFVFSEQYKRESFSVNIYPKKDEFPIKKGEIIAFSGNSGGSMGPHLHFEIRDEATQEPINPLSYGFEIKDFIRPTLQGLKVYLKNEGNLNGTIYELAGWGPNYHLKNDSVINAFGEIAFGIQAFDLQNDSKNKNGVYSISLLIDDSLRFQQKMDRYAFSESRYINSLIDYGEKKRSKRRFQRTEIDPNNKLKIYNIADNNGIFDFSDGKLHTIKYEVRDFAGNSSILKFQIQSDSLLKNESNIKNLDSENISWNKPFKKTENIFSFSAPKNAFYCDIPFEYSVSKMKAEGFYSQVITINSDEIPIHKYCTLSIKYPPTLPDSLKGKLKIVQIDKSGDISFIGGEPSNGAIATKLRSFGSFALRLDTICPKIYRKNIAENQNISDIDKFVLKISDDESGIKSYRATLNGEWILMKFDKKNDKLTYIFDDKLKKDKNIFNIIITDNCNNFTELEFTLINKNKNAEK